MRRNLKNGKFYKSKAQMEKAEVLSRKISKIRKEMATAEEMSALSKKGNSPEARKKKSITLKTYYKKNPKEFSRRIKQAYEKNPELRVQRATVLRVSRESMKNHYTDPENAEERRTTKDGKKVVKYVQKERPVQEGVVSYDSSDRES